MRYLACLLLLGIASGANAEDLVTRELHAFSIGLPDGEITKQSPHPGAGALVMMLNSAESLKSLGLVEAEKLLPQGARQIQVQWNPYTIATAEDRKVLIDTVLGALPIKGARVFDEKVISEERRQFVIGNEQFPMALGVVGCGPNFGIAITMAFTVDREALLAASERITRSVVCKPESVNPPRHELAVRLPKTFGRSQMEGVEMFMSTEGEMLVAGFVPQDMQRHPGMFVQLMSSMLSSLLDIPPDNLSLEVVATGGKAGDPASRTQTAVMHTGGELDGAYIYLRYCVDQDLSLFSVWYADEPVLKRARIRFDQIGCPGEATEKIREMPEVFGEACDAGDKVACEMIKEVEIL